MDLFFIHYWCLCLCN